METETNTFKHNRGSPEYLQSQILLLQKEYLTTEQAAIYLGLSKHTIYKLTSNRTIPIHKPGGKKIFISRVELEDWVSQFNKRNKKHKKNTL